jgi:hypothetical protein
VRRSHEQTCGNADTRSDQVPEHLLAGVNGPSSVIAGALFCYGVGNDLPGRAQNGVGAFRRAVSQLGNMRQKNRESQKNLKTYP